MADILRVTTPISGSDAASKIKQQGQEQAPLNINNLIDPDKIPKNDAKGYHDDSSLNKYLPNLKSNFDRFMSRVAKSPGMTQEMTKLFFTRFGSIVNSGINDGIALEMQEFLSMMQMSEGELLDMLKGFSDSSVKFSGEFFDILRNIVKDGNTLPDSKNIILEFLKKYDAITSNRHSLSNMIANLNNVADRMMKTPAAQLHDLIEGLNLDAKKGDVAPNLAVLRQNIIPFLSAYISQTKDFGSVRDNISLFILNFTRYELGSKEAFSEALNSLLGVPEVADKLSNSMVAELVDNIFKATGSEKIAQMQDKLVSIISHGLEGKAGYQNTPIFQNILQSALINESVYMPLLHMMVPVELAGKQMFSELWVDPDSQEQVSGARGGQAIKVLVKFDIKELGFFEMIMLIQDGLVDMQLFYPETLEENKEEIRKNIFNIIERNDMSFRSYFSDKVEQPKPISDVFPKIYEGRNMINVTA